MIQEKSNNHAVVIGAGFSGLATAALLAKQGWQVTVLEKNTTLGGRARVFKQDGFQFDMGPSWYLMPEVFEHFFARFDKKPSDFYSLLRLDPLYKIFFEGTSAVLSDDISKNVAWFERIEPGAGKKLVAHLSRAREAYDASSALLYENIWSLRFFLKKKNLKNAAIVFRHFPLWRSWHDQLKKYFRSELLQKILSFSAVFLGASPFKTPAFYSILNWADFGAGVWYPKGGMGKVVDALVELGKGYGVKIVPNAAVTEIIVERGRVCGVKTKEQTYAANVVVAATDLVMVETTLLPRAYQRYPKEYWQKKTLGISALLLYLGVNKRVKKLAHHNIYFSDDWQKNFSQILDQKVLPSDPSFYISARSITDRALVPPNTEELFVLVPLGAGGKYSEKSLAKFTEQIIKKIEKMTGQSLRNNLVVNKIFSPNDFYEAYNAFQGTALGLAHTLSQSLWLRPKNTSKVRGLYYAGQYTNPGVGVPMALISAEIVAKLIGEAKNDASEIFKRGSTTYYFSSIFFSGQVKRDVFSLYAYVRVIDDCVDQLHPEIEKFNQIWHETQHAWNGAVSSNALVANFIEVTKRKKIRWEWIDAFWDAMRSDLTKKNYASYQELVQYMYGSAEVIGMMMAKILDLPDEAIPTAAAQGKAMQLLNFIRDVSEDEALGRNYLGYTAEQKNDSRLWNKFIRTQIEQYRQVQSEAEKGYHFISKKYLVPIKSAADMYSWTAEQIFQNPALVWEKKLKPNKAQVIMKVIQNYLMLK